MAEYFDGEMIVRMERVRKENGVEQDGLSVCRKGAKASPIVYLEAFYEAYENGQSINELEEILRQTFEYFTKEIPFDPDLIDDPDYVKPRLLCRVVNTEKNREMLAEMPHRDFLNLSVIYYVLMEDLQQGVGGVKVRNDLLKQWKISSEELDRLARANTASVLPWEIHPISACLGVEPGMDDMQPPVLYVLSNKVQTLGAYWITEREVVKKCAETVGCSCYILPSSIHECILVPEYCVDDPQSLARMVREINDAAVEEKDVLASCAYYCDLSTGEVSLAAE